METDGNQSRVSGDAFRSVDRYGVQAGQAPGSMQDLLSVFWRRRGLIGCCIVVITLAAGIASVSMTPQYRATSELLLIGDGTDVISESPDAQSQDQYNSEIETYTRLLTSRSFSEAVISRLDLTDDPFFNPTLAEAEGKKPNPFWEFIDSIPFASILTQTGLANSDPSQQIDTRWSDSRIQEHAVSKLISSLNVRQAGYSSVIEISFTSTDAVQAASVANTVAEVFVQEQLRSKQTGSDEATGWLEKRVEELRQKVLASEREIARYRSENKIIDVGRSSLNDAEIAQISNNLIVAQARVAEKETKLAIIRKSLETGDGLATISEVNTSPAIAAIRQQEFALLSTEAQLREDFGPNHPRVIQLESEKARLEQKTRLELEKIFAVLANEAQIAREQTLLLKSQLSDAKDTLGTRDQAEVELAELEREAQANRDLYTRFLNRLKFLSEEQDLIGSGARIVSRAVPPNQPTFPQPTVIFVAGFVASVLSGGLIALVREGLERGLRHARQVEQHLGLPTLGMVPELKGRAIKPHRYLHKKQLSGYAEAVRNIHVSLQYGWVSKRPQVVLVTSSLPNEGKTTLAMSLSTSIAESGISTLLIDLDFRNPSVGQQMERVRPDTSVVNFINGSKTWGSTVHSEPGIKNLTIIPGSTGVPNPVHCLESSELKNFLEDMREEFDQIILDAPPVLGISDTRVAARLADAVILAVQWGQTKVDVAQNSIRTLAQHDTPVAGVVLTRIDVKKHAKLAFGDAEQHYKKYRRYYVD
jgi:capsular exopolysaccharide synthesis family protein